MNYKCGCRVPDYVRLNLGRGKPRQQRIDKINTECCRLCRVTALANQLTHIDGIPYTKEEREAYIEKRTKLL